MGKVSFGLDRIQIERKPIGAGGSVSLDMSFPPSTNNLFANGASGRYPTPQYKQWQDENSWRIMAGKFARVPGPVSVRFEFEERARKRDIDNCLKAPLDLLVKQNIIDGDNSAVVREITAKWTRDVTGVRITITSLGRAAA